MAKGKKEEKKEEKSAFKGELKILFVIVISILFCLSYANAAGVVGKLLSNLSFGLFGFLAYLLPFFILGVTVFFYVNKGNLRAKIKLACVGCMSLVLVSLLELITYHYDGSFQVMEFYTRSAAHRLGGGMIGGILSSALALAFGELGAYVILFALLAVAFMILTEKLIFQSLGKKSSKAYKKVKEKAEIVVKEREMERARVEELEELEDWEKSDPDTNRGRKFKFFTFKKASKETENAEEVPATEGMEEIKADEKTEQENDQQEKNTDDLEFLTIQRGDAPKEQQQEQKDFDIDIPIFRQEISNKFDQDQVSAEKQEQEQVTETEEEKDEKFMDSVEENLDHFVDSVLIEQDKKKEGIVMDAVEQPEDTPSLEQVVSSLSQPISRPEEATHGKASAAKKTTAAEAEAEVVNVEKMAMAKENAPKKKYKFPTLDLLAKPEKKQNGMSDERLKENARKLQATLESFGVGAKVVNVSCGPAVTRFELQPEQGVKVSKITGLADDIKLNMAAEEIRIEAPIPGKAAVGIEIPNETTTMVHLRDLVENSQFKKHKSNIAFAVGKDIGGQVVVTDIAKMPHLLIAGATGSGKSVCINTLIMSILYKAHPDDVKLMMIDPKVVELSCYNGIPHLLIPVVTDPKKASGALQWAVQEMAERYKKFAELSVREIKGYNEKIKTLPDDGNGRYKKMPQIVIIVDELADLMMVASKEVEDAICRLAQLARAAGIHLVIATQRPSVNVITGLIKANVPSRIAFAVSSAIDSRTILDGGGAEKLLGKGDMLFYPSGFPKPVRVQGAFVSDQEVNAVVEFLAKQNIAEYDQQIDQQITTAKISSDGEKSDNSGNDDYFEEAGKFIIEKNKASIGMLQRVYKIGFNRAARIMDQLCAAGVVGPEEGTKPRKVIMTMEEFEEYIR